MRFRRASELQLCCVAGFGDRMATGKHEILVPGSSRQTVTFCWLKGQGCVRGVFQAAVEQRSDRCR